MNRTRFLLLVPFGLGVLACAGNDATTSQSSDPSSPEGFCDRVCIPEDHDRCEAFASRFSDAFLLAFEQCGDDPSCIEPKLDAATPSERQRQLASDYCARCTSGGDTCERDFFLEEHPGRTVRALSDARIDQVSSACLAKAEKSSPLTCDLTWATCVIPFLQEDVQSSVVCRKRR